ncbi:hypothetical protein [Ralstonia pseudosolanacearum]|uniref:hypothetical protein n=1 Tax=Ralstonia pseudosolanacearum TaxID=1310165 RepID=UPI003CF77904
MSQVEMTKLQFAQLIVEAFPGFRDDDEVSGADLVDWMGRHLSDLKQVEGGSLHKKLRASFPGFGKNSDVNGGDLVEWVNWAFGDQFEHVVLKARLYEGNWSHTFGPGRAETQCRIVVDVANDKLIAAQAFDGLKWVDLSKAEQDDLADSLFDANDVSDAPDDWELTLIESPPQWAFPGELLLEGSEDHGRLSDSGDRAVILRLRKALKAFMNTPIKPRSRQANEAWEAAVPAYLSSFNEEERQRVVSAAPDWCRAVGSEHLLNESDLNNFEGVVRLLGLSYLDAVMSDDEVKAPQAKNEASSPST